MSYPTLEEYNTTLKCKENMINTLYYERQRRNKILDELYDVQTFIKKLEMCIEQANEKIKLYEIYQEVLKETKEKYV